MRTSTSDKHVTQAGLAKVILFTAVLASIAVALAVYRSANAASIQASAGLSPGTYAVSDGINVVATLAFDGEDNDDFANKLEEEQTVSSRTNPYVYIKEGDVRRRFTARKGDTVETILERAGVELGRYDETEPPLDAAPEAGGEITVTRKSYVTVRRSEKIPYPSTSVFSTDMTPGTAKQLSSGKDGRQTVYVRQLLVDGVVTAETVTKYVVEQEPVAEKVIRGFPVTPVSPYDFDYAFDENCEPIGYESVMRSQKSAGYTARAGARTASGMIAEVGTVAVDPSVIPYGTKLFIKSSDGKHIYGYAVAGDTGTALKKGIIAVDLFYATYQESADNGIRNVDIFILETPEKK